MQMTTTFPYRILNNFADMLDYPSPALSNIIQECEQTLRTDFSEIPGIIRLLREFRLFVEGTPLGRLEELYTGLFDMNPTSCLYVGYHLFGESYKRSAFLLGLKERYLAQDFSSGSELPDHLMVLLRFLATNVDKNLAIELIRDALLPMLAMIIEKREKIKIKGESDPTNSIEAYFAVLRVLQSVLQPPTLIQNLNY